MAERGENRRKSGTESKGRVGEGRRAKSACVGKEGVQVGWNAQVLIASRRGNATRQMGGNLLFGSLGRLIAGLCSEATLCALPSWRDPWTCVITRRSPPSRHTLASYNLADSFRIATISDQRNRTAPQLQHVDSRNA
jgi:hypothetical protein